MKISILIEELKSYKAHYGDLDVAWLGKYGGSDIEEQWDLCLDVVDRDKDWEDKANYPKVLTIEATSPALYELNNFEC